MHGGLILNSTTTTTNLLLFFLLLVGLSPSFINSSSSDSNNNNNENDGEETHSVDSSSSDISSPNSLSPSTPTTATTTSSSNVGHRPPSNSSEILSNEEFETEPSSDPFSILKWTQFKIRAGHIQDALINLTTAAAALQAQGQAGGSAGPVNKSTLAPLITSFLTFFQPLDEQLQDSIPYTKINPAVGLYTKPLLNALANSSTSKPYSKRDSTRLAWIEINSLAITIHYAFERLLRLLLEDPAVAGNDFNENIEDSLRIQYPSWLQDKNTVELDTYTLMDVGALVQRIHDQFDILGEKFQLLRGLEKLIRKKLKDLDPSSTDLNLYCFGNNDYIVLHEVPDLLTDAALYLIMADMKYFVLQTIATLNKEVWSRSTSSTNGTEPDTEDKNKQEEMVKSTIEAAQKNLTERVNKKIQIGTPVEIPNPEPTFGPNIFPCDPPPKPTPPPSDDGTSSNDSVAVICLSSPLSPNVHIINNVVTLVDEGNKPAKLHEITKYPIYDNGSLIPGIQVHQQYKTSDGSILEPSELHVTTSNDSSATMVITFMNGTILDGATVEYIYFPYDRLPRVSPHAPQFSATEWGRYHCDLSINSSIPGVPKDPPFGGDPAPTTSTPLPPKEGYVDTRRSNFNAAQFALAYSGYIEAELVLNPNHNCVGTCADYHHSPHGYRTCSAKDDTICDLYRSSFCDDPNDSNCLTRSKCKTKARRCISTSPKVQFCENGNVAVHGRIYDWIQYKDGKLISSSDMSNLGGEISKGENENPPKPEPESAEPKEPPSCNNVTRSLSERWDMGYGVILNSPEYCELCLCVCDQPLVPEGYHVFGLVPALANVSEGFIITALRFEQLGQTMILNAEQCRWVADGHVDLNSCSWLEPPEIDKLAEDGSYVRLSSEYGVNGGFNKINLDNLYTSPNEVVTGVRVVVDHDGALNLQIQATSVNGADGSLNKSPNEGWKGVDAKKNKVARVQIDLSDAESSLKQTGPSQPLIISGGKGGDDKDNDIILGKYVRFDASSLEKDGGQSVLPFFDLQSSHHHSPIIKRKALQGIGISYKAKSGYGGFLIPSVTLYKKYFA